MRAPGLPSIGQAELEILKYIQEHSPVSVRTVAAHFSKSRGLVRTTTLNVMERLRKKGYLVRTKRDGIFQYSSRVPQAALLRRLVHEFVQKTLAGSVSPFVAYLAAEGDLNETELAELRQLVAALGKPRRE
jgi:predicted transcriptional regulator